MLRPGRHAQVDIVSCSDFSVTGSSPQLFADDVKVDADDSRGCACCPASVGTDWRRDVEPRSSWMTLLMVMPYHIIFASEFITFGLFYVEYCNEFDASKSVVGFVAALKDGTALIAGVFTGALLQTFGSRTVALAGAALMAVSALTTAFAPSLAVLYITDGVLMGISRSMGCLSCVVLLQKHFDRNRALAGGIGMLGYSLGNLIGPIITHQLIEAYGWRGAQLVLSAIYANALLAALMFREPVTGAQGATDASPAAGEGTIFSGEIIKPSESLRSWRDELQDCNKGEEIAMSARGSHETIELTVADQNDAAPSLGQKWRDALTALCDFSLFKEATFVLMTISLLLFEFFLMSFLMHIPSRALVMGFSTDAAASLLPIFSMASLTTRAATTLLTNLACVNRIVYFAIGEVIGGLSCVILVLFHSYRGQLAAMVTFGTFVGCTNTIVQVVLVDLFGLSRLARTIGLASMVGFLAPFTATPLMGWLYDVTGNYDIPYVLNGCLIAVSAILAFAVAAVHHRTKKINPKTADLDGDAGEDDSGVDDM